jgi:hypothetical protein
VGRHLETLPDVDERLFGSKLDERGRRHFAAVEARTAGHGGIVAVHEITGIASLDDRAWFR